MARTAFVVIAMLLFGGMLFAGCAYDAYKKACANCPFDENGRIDRSCSDSYKASGIACVSSNYPIMSTKYSAGDCPAVDACASELSSCVAQYSTGNDRADCQEGSVSVCYYGSDECVKKAAVACGEIENPCAAPTGLILLTIAGVGLARYVL